MGSRCLGLGCGDGAVCDLQIRERSADCGDVVDGFEGGLKNLSFGVVAPCEVVNVKMCEAGFLALEEETEMKKKKKGKRQTRGSF